MKYKKTTGKAALVAHQNIKEKDYWLETLAGIPDKTHLPYDYVKKSTAHVPEASFQVRMPGDISGRLLKISGGSDAKLHMLLATALFTLIYKYTHAGDLTIGAPIYKPDKDGEFLNLVLPLRCVFEETISFKELLMKTRQTLLGANEHRNYPIDFMTEQLGLETAEGEDFPLFDIALLLDNIHMKEFLHDIKTNLRFRFNRSGGGIDGVIEYTPSRYRENTIERMFVHLTTILRTSLSNLDIQLTGIDILPEEEKHQLLTGFNRTQVEYPRDKTFHRLFEEQAERTPRNIALVGREAAAPDNPSVSLDYRRLNEKSNQLAHLLQARGVQPGDLVCLMTGRTVELMIGLLAILKTGAAYLPLDPTYPPERTKYILKDAGASLLLTTKELENLVDSGIQSISIDTLEYRPGQTHNPLPAGSPNHLIYVIYTSGSTGNPKGVMIEHRALNNFIEGIINIIPFPETARVLSLTTISFDIFGLETLLPLSQGARVVLGTLDEQYTVEAAAQVIVQQEITILQLTPSRLSIMLQQDDFVGAIKRLDYLLVGGEAFPEQVLERTREAMTGKIYNMYGPTETTIWSTVKDVGKGQELNIGKPIANTRVYILGRNRQLQPIGVFGDLWIAGDGLARGYTNKPGLTSEKFIVNPYDTSTYLYGTGDLARWLPDGNIQFMGRKDHQVKIRGFRIELGEIEYSLQKHRLVHKAVVNTAEIDAPHGTELHLVGYVVLTAAAGGTFDSSELRSFLTGELPDYMVPYYFVVLDEIPLTPNGKINKKALPPPKILDSHADLVPPTTETEKTLAQLWSDVVGIDKEKIGIDTNFFQLGGHSLKATILSAKIHSELDVKIPLTVLFKNPTIKLLAQTIKNTEKKAFTAIEAAPEKPYYALSSAQKRLFLIQQMNPQTTGYNLPGAFISRAPLDRELMTRVFKRLILRHESLRTSFKMAGGEPRQFIHEDAPFQIETHHIPPGDPDTAARELEIITGFVRPFDLAEAPLFRIGIVTVHDERSLLLVDMHHIISDATSLNQLIGDFTAIQAGVELPPLRLQYKDFSEWQHRQILSGELQKQEDFWLNEYKSPVPPLDLPLDQERDDVADFAGETLNFTVGEEETAYLKELAREEDATMFMVLLALYVVLLSRVSGQDDIVVGTGLAGRGHADLQSIIGMFVNTLALRNYPAAHKTFRQFAGEVRERTLQAFENQDFLYEDLVEKVLQTRPQNRNPLFDTVFMMQALETGDAETGPPADDSPLTLEIYEFDTHNSSFEMLLSCEKIGKEILFAVTYRTRLFKRETIETLIEHYKEIISTVMKDKEIPLGDIKLTQHALAAETTAPDYDFDF